ncbi:unnamed protein product [Rotaria sordida]|uniref:Peptidase C14 caspase domain-containing protein n=1 Tax=Rotaria sordida TaxID=392033 RepID=A0A819QJX5_9BILA|nr:unnamed protein product [Rotaria sordida]
MTSSVVYRQKHALIIGINNYLLNPLEYCINDAEDLEKILQRIDFHVLLGIDCNLYKFYSIIDIFTNRIQQDDLILFYFAGHGKQMKDDDYLLPVDYYLLPVDYYYDYRGNEQDYIIKHAINVKHMIRTRSLNSNHNLLFMNGSSQTLIVFACAPGNAVQDETRNNRNGSFMENLLKHITIPNKDIEEIMKQVADDVNKQTDGFQLLHRISSWLGKVFLVQNKNQVSPGRSVPFQQTEDLPNFKIFDKSFDQCPTSVNHYNKVSKTPRPNPSFNIELVFHSSTSSSSENAEGSDNDNDILPKPRQLFLKSERNQKSTPSITQSVQSDFQNNSDLISEEKPMVSSQLTSVNTIHEDNHVSASSIDTKSLNVRMRTLFRKLSVKIPIETTVKDLITIIWREIQFNIERYTKDSHVLLLFNHRLHIFIESDSTTLVKDFILLTPPSSPSSNDSTDFYIYGLSLEQAVSMYNFDNDYISLLCNSDSWCPSYFIEPEHRELMAKQLAMEAQFFLELRKYLFPPAILALKHAIIGSIFWFEKSLLMDGLIQLLIHLRDPNTGFVEEIFDFLPLLIC